MVPANRRLHWRTLLGLGVLGTVVSGCPGNDGGTGVGGVLIVAQVQIEAGLRDVLIGGTRQLVATPRTSTGISVPDKTITWSSTATNVATVDQSGLVHGIAQGSASIRATVDGITGQVTVDVKPVPVASVEVSLDAGTLVAGETTMALASVYDSVGGLLLGRQITFSSSDQGVATVSSTGLVTATGAGPVAIIATSEGKSGQAPLTVLPRTAVKLGFLTQPSTVTAGAAIAPPIQVAFQDGAGATAAQATGIVTLSFSANPTGAVLSGSLSAAAVGGVATFPNVRIDKAGQPYSLQATASGVTLATSSTFAVTPGAATSLAIVTAPAGSAASGAPLAVQPVIELRDGLGNPVLSAGVAVTASVATGAGVVAGTATVSTGSNGRASFTNLAIVGAVGTYTLRFQASGLAEVISSPIAVGAGGGSQLGFTAAPPATAINGASLPAAVRVQIRDGTGNPVAQGGVQVTAALATGNGILSGTLAAITGANGEATFSNLTFTGLVGTFSLRFSASGLSDAVSNPITLQAGPAHSLSFVTAPPATAVNGATLTATPVIQLRDVSGNAVTASGVSVSVSVQTPVTGLVQGTLTQVTDGQGRATFSGLSILGQVGSYTLTFRSGTLSEAIALPLQLQAGPATAIAFATTPPGAAQSGVALAPQPAIRVVDQSGNPVASPGVPVTATLLSGPGALGGTLVATTGANGTATFTDLVLSGTTGSYTLSFSAPGFASLVSAGISVGAGAATRVSLTTAPPATAQNGVAIAPAVTVQLLDAVGNPAAQSGVTVTASLASGAGALGGTVAAVTGGGGSASFANLVITGVTGSYVLQFDATGLTGAVANPLTLTAGAATQLTFTTAPPALATNGVDLAPAVVVQLRDLSGNPVAQGGTSVAVSLASGSGAVLSGTTPVLTAGTGAATFSNLRLTGLVGSVTLQFTAAGLSPAVSNTVTLQAGPATALVMATQPPPSAASGAVLVPQPAVRLVDQSGNPVSTSGVTVTAALETGPGTLGGTLTANTVSGVATYTNLALTGSTGSYAIRFSASGVTDIVSGTIGIGAGAATALSFANTPPTTATNGVALSPSIRVRLVDASSNNVNQSGVVVTAVLASGSGSLGGTVSETTNGSGQATFANLILTGSVGTYTIRFDVAGVSSVTTAAITLAAGAATKLAVTTQPPATAINGVDFATPTVIQLQDVSGNPVSTSGVSITAALVSGTGTLSGTLTVATGGGGTATFSNLRVTGPTGSKILQFTNAGLTSVNASAVVLGPGAPTQLAMVTQPSSTASNTMVLAQQPVVQLQDQSGNPVSQSGVAIAAAFGTTPGSAVLGGTTTVSTGGTGQAAFTNLAISGTSGGYTLTFSSTGLASVTSGTITLATGAATQVLFTTGPPASVANGAVLAPAVVVRRADATGNPVTTAGVTINAAIGSGAGATLGGTLAQMTDGTGAATFADLTLTGTTGNFTLTFTEGALTPATSGTVALTPGAATKLALTTTPPATSINGAILAPPITVELRDQSDNMVSTAGVAVTASISSGPAGSLGGTLTRTTAAGVATFDDLALTGTVGNYTLRFASTGLTGVTSPTAVAVTAGPASALGFNVAPPATATSGSPLVPQPQVQVRDQSGNPVGQAGVLITATVSAGGVTSATATTDGTGLAVFSGLTLTGPSGSVTLDFDASGYPTLTSAAINLTAGTATQMAFITAPPASAVNGALLAPQPVVELRDGSGNPVLVAGTSVTATVLSGAGMLAGTATVQTAADGRASFTDLALQGMPGTYVIRFSSGGIPDLDSGSITLAIGPATQLIFQAAPPTTATNGSPLGSNTVVALADLTGNVVPSNGVSVMASIASGPGAVLGGTTTRSTASGLATFDDLVLTGTAGTYTLGFSSSGVTPATSNNLTLQAGPATQLFFVNAPGIPASGASGVALSPAPVVQLRDASNNNVSQAGVSVVAAIFSPSGNGAVLGGASVLTNASGQAIFSALTISGPATSYTLSFTSPPLTGLVSPPVAISAGSAVKLAFITTPSTTATNGTALAQQPAVELRDAADNPVLQAGVAITVAVGAGSAVLSGTSLVVNTLADGRATFAGLTLTGLVGPHTLEFSGAGLTTLVSGTVTLAAGARTALAIETQPPATATGGVALSPTPSARFVDQSGNPVADAGVNVDVAVVGGGATLGGTTTVATDASGLATFGGISLSGPSSSYQLEFTSAGVTPDTSAAIALTTATALAITTQPSAIVQDDSLFSQQPVIQVVDGSSAPVALAGVVVSVAVKTGTGTLLGTLMATTDGSGVATFTDLKLKGTAGLHTLEFTASGLTAVTSGNINLQPGDPAALLVSAQPPATATSGASLSSAPAARLVDGSGNSVLTSGTSVDVAIVPGGSATLGGTTTQPTDGTGTATFAGLSITGAAGSYRLEFSSGSLRPDTSTAITLAAATALSVTTEPSAAVRNDEVFAQQPAIQLVDGSNAPVAVSGVVVTAAINSGGGSLMGTLTATSDVNGLATFSNLRIQGLVGVRDLAFTAPGLTGATSASITVSAGTATTIAMVTQPPAATVDAETLATAPGVKLVDISGNDVDSTGVSIAVATSPAGATLGGTTSQPTDVNGEAAFPGLTMGGTAGNYFLDFTGTSLAAAQSASVALVVPDTIVVTVAPPATAADDVLLSPQPTVRVDDVGATPLVGVSVTVDLVVVSGAGTLAGTTVQVTGAGGTASWTDLKIQTSGGTGQFRLRFRAANGAETLSGLIDIP